MKFGHEYAKALANEGFPAEWLKSAIDYKHLKKSIKKVQRELQECGLDPNTVHHLSEWADENGLRKESVDEEHGFFAAARPDLTTIPEEFSPQLRVLVDAETGTPLDATLAPETKETLKRLAKHEMVLQGRHAHLGHDVHHPSYMDDREQEELTKERQNSLVELPHDAKWIQIPLFSAGDFFDMLAPKLEELEMLREAETEKLEEEILDLGDAVEDVIEPVREGFEAIRSVSYRDLYFWRELFRLYMEKPIFYSETEQNRGALTFKEAKSRLQAYDQQIRDIGLLSKMKTPQAKKAAQQFLDVNLNILKIMQFQEMNSRAMSKILKKFDKRTHLEGRQFLTSLRSKYPALMPPKNGKVGPGAFANSIARDLAAEMATKVLAIVPQIDDWNCPVCYGMAWRPVQLGCCSARYCIRCVIRLQDEDHKRCPMCNAETVMAANGKNIDFEAMDFLEKYFPLECKKRQKENDKADLERRYGEEFVKPGCAVQ